MTKRLALLLACSLLAAPAFAQEGKGTNGPTTNETSSKGTGVAPPDSKPAPASGTGVNGPGTDTTSSNGTGVKPRKHKKKKGPNDPNGKPTTDPAIKQ